MFNVRLASDYKYEKWLSGDVFDGVLFCAVLSPYHANSRNNKGCL